MIGEQPMRTLAVCLAVLATLSVAAIGQREKPSGPPKKGDLISVRGCLTGGALEATDLGSVDATRGLSSAVTFRLTGDSSLLKKMRDEADGKVVDVQGRLKSDLPQENVQSRKVGKVRITIGSPATTPGSLAAEGKRSLPVLEVTSFEGSTTGCGR
jgi:hypothetical protein